MRQIYKVDSGGVHWGAGQTIGQKRKSTRRGVGWNKVLVMGPTEMVYSYHQRWWCGCDICCTGEVFSLQLCLGVCGTHRKNHKNIMVLRPWSWGGRLLIVKVSGLNSQHKIPQKSCKFCKIWGMHKVTFMNCTLVWLFWILNLIF